jgi:hypothetical protein
MGKPDSEDQQYVSGNYPQAGLPKKAFVNCTPDKTGKKTSIDGLVLEPKTGENSAVNTIA